MYSEPKNDAIIMRAIAASSKGHHAEASRLFQRAGNQERNPKEKEELWKASRASTAIYNSD